VRVEADSEFHRETSVALAALQNPPFYRALLPFYGRQRRTLLVEVGASRVYQPTYSSQQCKGRKPCDCG
jgi:hypothetical protein